MISQNRSQPIVISFRTFLSWTRNTFRAVQLLIWLRSLYKLSILSKVYQLLSLALLVYLCTESDSVNCDALWVWVLFISPSFISEKQKIKKVVSTKINRIYRLKYFSLFERNSQFFFNSVKLLNCILILLWRIVGIYIALFYNWETKNKENGVN